MRPNPRPIEAARLLWLVWAVLLTSLFPGCEGNNRLNLAVADDTNILRGRIFHSITGHELAGATVKLIPEGETFVTTSAGTFVLHGANVGTHRLEVSRDGFNTRVEGVLLPHRGTLALDVGLVPTTFTGTVSGRVIDAETGAPLAGVRVTVPQQRATIPLPGGAPQLVASAITDADGKFQLGPVGAGGVDIVFESNTHRTTVARMDVPANGNADAVFRLLLTSGSIHGTVRSTRNSLPLTAAEVSILSTPTVVLTDAQGAYTIAPLFAGTYAVEFNAPGHDRLEITTSVFPGKTTLTNVTLRFNLARLLGTVHDGNGTGLPNAVVSVPALQATSRTDSLGRYDFGFTLHIPFPVRPLAVGASAQNFASAAGFAAVEPSQTVTQDFTLSTSSGNLIGQVVSSVNNQPVIGAVVSLPTLNQARVTDLFGSFNFFAIPAAITQVDIQAAGFTRLTTFVPVFASRTNGVRFTLSP